MGTARTGTEQSGGGGNTCQGPEVGSSLAWSQDKASGDQRLKSRAGKDGAEGGGRGQG